MGTHLSAYIEVDHGKGMPPFTDPAHIYSLTEGSFSFDRNYEVFDALAGGRDAAMPLGDRDASRAPLITPRGVPSPCSLAVGWDYYRLITDPPGLPDSHFWPAWRCVSVGTATEWLRDKRCHEAELLQWFNCEPLGREWRVVTVPGTYNASWLHLDEFDAALRHHSLELAVLPVEYSIIRSAMAKLGKRHGSDRVRLVIWFS